MEENPYFEKAVDHMDPTYGMTGIAYAMLAVAWELREQRRATDLRIQFTRAKEEDEDKS